ncbi:uncharacterized protein TDEL_0B00790 [Torulaspora delbrueckii]|uniref:Swiss Army Knife RNA repair protein HAD domain-containing protein n=1 Tax=Torulaspora delbrueckii TaxID=4950 RepID=G8ZNL4_TORDE|nr:hypothetical protein TDEL_0B00790 [Torulaspora delbrueckii]CCE90208.1 hypothetical protein TDEL_0B00790 [Torulaspora delbrueckii]
MEMADHGPLHKWNSCPDLLNVPKVPIESLKKLHVYDFDNTLYCSPHPNKQLYTKKLYDRLYNSSSLLNGGWWSEPCFLEQSFTNMINSSEEERAKYWNIDMLELARKSEQDPQAISIVLTGRKEVYFASMFSKMFLELDDLTFNAVCLKRANCGSSTAEYKISLITDFLDHYPSLNELIIYDDRPQQIKVFERAFSNSQVVHVQPQFKMLEVSDECRLVKEIFERYHMANSLVWTPPTCGFIVDRTTYRTLINWTFRFFKKKYKMSLLPHYPMYIPLAADTNDEIARIWSNNNPQVMKSPSSTKEICDRFHSQQNLQGNCAIKFNVIEIGYRTSEKYRRTLEIYYKVEASDSNRYVSPSPTTLMAISTETTLPKGRTELNSLRWVSLDRPIKLKTVLGHFARLTTTD